MFIPAILSGVLLWASFFPLNLGPLAFIALVPWLTLVRAPGSNRRRYLAAYLGGFVFFLASLQWIRVAHPMMYLSWIGLALYCPLYWAAALFLIRRLDRLRMPLAVSVPLAWVALEYTRAHFPTGFPFLQSVGLHQLIGFGWYFLGYTQHEFLALTQIADLGGVYAVSFLVAMVNGAVADVALSSSAIRARLKWDIVPSQKPLASLAVTLLLFFGALAYGFVRLNHAPFAEGPRLVALQGSVPQEVKMEEQGSQRRDLQDDPTLPAEERQRRKAERDRRTEAGLAATYRRLYTKAIALEPKPDLIIWPETCCNIDWFEPLPSGQEMAASADYRVGLDVSQSYLVGSQPPVDVLLGLTCYAWEDGSAWKYNSAVHLAQGGVYRGRYDKMHLVPFGEYVPLRETFPWMQTFTPYNTEYSCRPGERWTRFTVKGNGRDYTFGCLICYQASDPSLARQYVASAPVDFLVNISNDGWFKGTEEHEQHLAICRFRAIEARRSILRSVNMGISCAIDPDGRVIALPGESWSASKKVEQVMPAVMPLDARVSWYARLGDWLPAACWLSLLLGVTATVVMPRKSA